jgi:hypothetical protein
MTAPALIGLAGHKRSGEDTAALRLTEHYGFTRVAFADPIRQAAYALNPLAGFGGTRPQEVVDSIGWERVKVEPPRLGVLSRASASTPTDPRMTSSGCAQHCAR